MLRDKKNSTKEDTLNLINVEQIQLEYSWHENEQKSGLFSCLVSFCFVFSQWDCASTVCPVNERTIISTSWLYESTKQATLCLHPCLSCPEWAHWGRPSFLLSKFWKKNQVNHYRPFAKVSASMFWLNICSSYIWQRHVSAVWVLILSFVFFSIWHVLHWWFWWHSTQVK